MYHLYWSTDVLHIIYMHVDQNNTSDTANDPISQLIPDQIKYMYWGGIELFPCHLINKGVAN